MTTYSIAQLSALIAGEARSPADQFGVAATIQNRVSSNYMGLGGVFGQAFNHNQFEAYPNKLGVPTPYTDQLAAALSNGTLSNYGDTGNALFYNAPGYNSAYASGTGNSFGAGSNQYSDVYNRPPSSNFILPQAGATPSNSNMFDGNSGLMNGSDAFGSGGAGASSIGDGSFVSDNNPFGDTFGGTQSPESLGGPAKPVAGGDTGIPGISSQGTGTFNDMTASPSQTSDNPIQPTAKAGSGASAGTAPQGKDKGNDSGAKLDVTNAPAIGSDAANTLSQALGGVTQGAASDTKSLEGTGTGWLNSIFSGATSLLVRGGLIMAGLFLLLGAFVFFYADSQASKKG